MKPAICSTERTPWPPLKCRVDVQAGEHISKTEAERMIAEAAEMLKTYACQRDDTELALWVSELHLRACQRVGQRSRVLEKAQVVGGHTEQGQAAASAATEAYFARATAAREPATMEGLRGTVPWWRR